MSNDPFAELGKKKSRAWIAWVVIGLVAVGGGVAWFKKKSRPLGIRYLSAHISRGDITEVIETSGNVQPVVQVTVGSQVSGRIARVLVDFNDRVTRGQLLAEIDPTPLRAAVAQARAAVASSEAQLARARVNARVARVNFDRATALRAQNLNAVADVDTSRGQLDLANADLAVISADIARQRASLTTAETNLNNTRIVSPIDGVVITRSIDEGQTVAASFQAPTLFVLAADLTQMRVVANVDESDVSKLREHQVALARVDAFPGRNFRGEVTEVRFGSVVTSGVVTYPAVITVANPQLELRPGMTATVTVVANRHQAVLRVPNAALRYTPAEVSAQQGVAEPQDPLRTPEHAARRGTVYVLENNRPRRVEVELGLADGTRTEVTGPGLREGLDVVTDEIDQDRAASSPARGGSPGMGGSGGGRRRGM